MAGKAFSSLVRQEKSRDRSCDSGELCWGCEGEGLPGLGIKRGGEARGGRTEGVSEEALAAPVRELSSVTDLPA